VALGYILLDAAAYNSLVCLVQREPERYAGHQQRRKFLADLSEQLCNGQIQRRYQEERIQRGVTEVFLLASFAIYDGIPCQVS
jgi:hypothetical protein